MQGLAKYYSPHNTKRTVPEGTALKDLRKKNVITLRKHQPLTPPSATPSIMYLDSMKYAINIGTTVKNRPR